MAQGVRWSGPFRFFNLRPGQGLHVDNRPGVYRIRAFHDDGKAFTIPRLRGIDSLGILHIGKSVDLKRRIREFSRSVEGTPRHQAGNELYRWRSDRAIPPRCLRYEYYYTATGDDALEEEGQLQKRYRDRYLDRLPLDATSGPSSRNLGRYPQC